MSNSVRKDRIRRGCRARGPRWLCHCRCAARAYRSDRGAVGKDSNWLGPGARNDTGRTAALRAAAARTTVGCGGAGWWCPTSGAARRRPAGPGCRSRSLSAAQSRFGSAVRIDPARAARSRQAHSDPSPVGPRPPPGAPTDHRMRPDRDRGSSGGGVDVTIVLSMDRAQRRYVLDSSRSAVYRQRTYTSRVTAQTPAGPQPRTIQITWIATLVAAAFSVLAPATYFTARTGSSSSSATASRPEDHDFVYRRGPSEGSCQRRGQRLQSAADPADLRRDRRRDARGHRLEVARRPALDAVGAHRRLGAGHPRPAIARLASGGLLVLGSSAPTQVKTTSFLGAAAFVVALIAVNLPASVTYLNANEPSRPGAPAGRRSWRLFRPRPMTPPAADQAGARPDDSADQASTHSAGSTNQAGAAGRSARRPRAGPRRRSPTGQQAPPTSPTPKSGGTGRSRGKSRGR